MRLVIISKWIKQNKAYSLIIVFLLLFLISLKRAHSQNSSNYLVIDSLRKIAINTLKQNLKNLQGWNKVHAAEYLLWTNHTEGIKTIFLGQNQKFSNKAEYRIGIWRVLAEATQSPERDKWIDKIVNAFMDTTGLDRIWAAETLSKLKISPLKLNPIITIEALENNDTTLSLYTRWSICYSSTELQHIEQCWFLNFLKEGKGTTKERCLVAYIISNLGTLSQREWAILSYLSLKEPVESKVKVCLLSAAYISAPSDLDELGRYNRIKKEFFTIGSREDKGSRTELAIALAKRGRVEDIDILTNLINTKFPLPNKSDNLDVNSAASYGILSILSREKIHKNHQKIKSQ